MLRVELTRLRWRRAVLLLAGVGMIVPLGILVATIWNTKPITPAESTTVQAQIERDSRDPSFVRDLRVCLEDPELYGVESDQNVTTRCRDLTQPQEDWYFFREPLELAQQKEESGVGVVAVLAATMLLLGTTFAGHDWNTGSISNQLLFESRRRLVWTAKGLAVFLVGLTLTGIVLAAFWSGLWFVADQRGLSPTGADVKGAYMSGIRGTLVAAGAGVFGYAATMLFRSTVATLGLLFAVSVIAPLLIGSVGFQGGDHLMPEYNFLAIVLGEFVIEDFGQSCAGGVPTADFGSISCVTRISLMNGTVYYGLLLLIVAAASLVLFDRRDVQ